MPERDDAHDHDLSFKALPVFRTLRTNLALFSAFSRRSYMDTQIPETGDLGFLGVPTGESQPKAHNNAIMLISTMFLAQALKNYREVKNLLPRLEDPAIEKFLNAVEGRNRIVQGMAKARNAVFHLKSRRAWRDRDVRHFSAAWTLALAAKLSDLLYAFTAKCFMGDLKIWPLRQYEEFEALDPELRARMDTGEASFDEFIEALNRVSADHS